jgi:glucose-1-phosphate cytidylyltransferase
MTCDVTIDMAHPERVTYHGQVEENDWRITLADTGECAETGARVWKARRYFEDDEQFCLTYGDGVADLNLNKLRQQHEHSGMTGTLSGVRPAGRFGELEFDGSQVVRFNEKPNALGGYINGGYMVFNTHDALSYFRDGEDLNLEREVLPAMVKKGVLGVYKHDGFWQCMDTRREHDLLNDEWRKGTAPWKVWP